MVKVIFHTIWNCSKRKEVIPSGSKFFLLRDVPIFKKHAIDENRCLIQYSPFDARNFSAFWLRHCSSMRLVQISHVMADIVT